MPVKDLFEGLEALRDDSEILGKNKQKFKKRMCCAARSGHICNSHHGKSKRLLCIENVFLFHKYLLAERMDKSNFLKNSIFDRDFDQQISKSS